jgi:ATP-binding cassette subfamily F protein 3
MIAIDQLTLRIAGRPLLDGASVQLPTGSRVGLVGRNGVGKTTLLRAIAGEHLVESGSITTPRRGRIGSVDQEASGGNDRLIDVVLRADSERHALLSVLETTRDSNEIAEIQSRLFDIGAHAAPARAAAILAGLGFSSTDLGRPISELSGGWRMRVALAALLFSEPELLMLDEPTNYLDLEGTLWLQDYLARYPHMALIVSHDRDLLDNAVDHILHLDRGKLTLYRGNYSAFERQRRERLTFDLKFAKRQETERQRLQAFVDRFRAKASKARQAQSRLKMLARLGPAAIPIESEAPRIEIQSPEKPLSPPIIALEGASVGYTPGEPILRRLTLRIDDDDRIALLGANGNGKSTLARLLADRLQPSSGTVVRADRLKVAYFAQHQLEELRGDQSPFEHGRGAMPDLPESNLRARLGAWGFSGSAADTAVSKLSGGEKARLLLGLTTLSGPHLVILDEPTNHLDVDGRAALIDAINAYTGAVIMVSHDRHLLDACADRLWLVAEGTARTFDGDLEDYRRLVLSARASDSTGAADRTRSKPSRTDARRGAAEKRARLAPLKHRVARAEALIERLNNEIAQIDAILNASDVFAQEPARAVMITKRRAEVVAALQSAEEQWLAASSEYEASAAR